MLEVKNLIKKYSGKGGVTVKALDDVSVKFPETGMVFLLGRSGSGKSTLLNVAGGLDKPDGGEVIVKGRSSKNFSAADFDSYRNTFVGFVFQEYNILNEFTIEQNIALALQLQNKPNDKKAVSDLLKLVDLEGYGKRKPNTLSGGQKQRVAIARALIKNPEIIMADEPTGALDSNTGKQVLDTLKKLSETKLVIVVSHDREFAEFYGDRIIELKDGKIISDTSKTYYQPEAATANVNIVGDDTITIKNAEELTEKDIKSIVSVLKKSGGEAVITASKNEIKDVKRACKINDDGSRESFKDTENVDIKEYDGKKTKFIKSHLPLGHAVKMGSSGLKGKPIRLIFTVLLSVVAFVMFGVASTFMLYDPDYSISKALETAAYPNVVVGKYYDALEQNVKIDNDTGEEEITYERDRQFTTRFTTEELVSKNKNGLKFTGVFNFTSDRYGSDRKISLILKNGTNITQVSVKNTEKYYYPVTEVFGFTDCGAAYMAENGFTLVDGVGAYPVSKDEIAIPEYIAELFINTEGSGITSVNQMIGKKLRLSIGNGGEKAEPTIVGVYKVGAIPAKYDTLKNVTTEINEKQDQEKFNLANSLEDFIGHSFNTVLFVSDDFYDTYKGAIQSYDGNYIESEWIKSLELREDPIYDDGGSMDYGNQYFTDTIVERNKSSFAFYNFDGTEKTTFTLNDGEVYISLSRNLQRIANNYSSKLSEYAKYDNAVKTALEDADYENIRNNYSDSNIVTVFGYLKNYYKTVAYKNYVYEAAKYLYDYDYSHRTEDFKNAYNKANEFINSSGAELTVEEWNVLATAVTNDLKTNFPQKYYYVFANEMQSINYNVFGTELESVVNQMQNNSASNEDYNAILAIINEKYTETTGKILPDNITGDYFAIDLSSGYKTVYYRDRSGATGTLNVVGYFKLSSGGSEYILTENFINAHGIKENKGDGTTWKTRYVTDYVEPETAKYNYIVSNTDNSHEQISAALEGNDAVSYKIINNVCQELEFFLDLITELQTVFLIVALVVGVFAALMLLNFISVSISSKRKEIGVLRAVGARGSDVFKIFFSEAFIIALICFILATIGSFIVCFELNKSLVDVVQMQLLNFSTANVGLIFGISFGISVIATFLPVFLASKKSPVESIRAL